MENGAARSTADFEVSIGGSLVVPLERGQSDQQSSEASLINFSVWIEGEVRHT